MRLFTFILIILFISCNERGSRNKKNTQIKEQQYRKTKEMACVNFKVYNNSNFELISLDDVQNVTDSLIESLSDADIYYEFDLYKELTNYSYQFTDEFFKKKYMEVENNLYDIRVSDNVSSEQLELLSSYYFQYKELTFFKKIWFVDPKLSFSENYISYVSYGKVPFSLKKNNLNIENIDDHFIDYDKMVKILREKLLLSWEDDKREYLIQDYYYTKMLNMASKEELLVQVVE